MVNITNINPDTLTLQNISAEDISIIPNTIITSSFSPVNDRIEYFVYDFNDNLLYSNPDLRSYKPVLTDSEGNLVSMEISPEADAIASGYDTGIVKTIYNFVAPQFDSENQKLYISEISPSRTEIRLSSNTNPLFQTDSIIDTFLSSSNYNLYTTFRQNVETSNYFDEFYLDFGNNIYVVGVNSLLEYDSQNNTISLLVKLYEPLPTNIGLKTELYIVTKKAESIAYQIEFVQENFFQDSTFKLSGPNYNIPLKDETGPLTQYKNYDDIVSTTLSGSYFQLLNNISSSSPELSIDYTDYEDFIFFSSAYQRLYNFKEKVTNISASQAQLNLLYSNITGPTTASIAVSSSKILLEKEIETIISSFDGYENFLYYTSGAYAWPKSNTQAPYVLYPPTSTQAINWYATQSATASLYDLNNQNNLDYIVPEYLRSDPSNTNYMLFTSMIGQFFDEIWIYTKAITSKLDANSNLYEGVSKDLVATVLESLGTKIYDSTYTLENIYSSLIGLSSTGALYPSTGSEMITNYVTASVPNTEDIPTIDDFVKLSYKKIYHNLPYLLKKKGTNAGLKALINIFGIPDTILQINEFGGKNKIGNNDWDYWQDKFNYKLDIENINQNFVLTPWQVNTLWNAEDNRPNTIQFRFKTPGLNSALTYPSQSLWNLDNAGNTALVLEYTGSGYTTGSYSGSITSSFSEYATLKFIPNYGNDPASSASIYLPFFDGGWWSVMVTRTNDNWNLYAANKIYNGSDGFIIGYTGSASSSGAVSTAWASAIESYFGTDGSPLYIGPKTYENFSGSYQEIRYYNTLIPSGTFYDYVMNPSSIEGVGINGAYDQLIFRGTLGNDLYTASKSMHPKITGSYITQSFASNSNFDINDSTYSINREFTFQDQIPAGVRNAVSKKIKNVSTILPYSGSNEVNLPQNTTLSPFIYIDQDSYNSSSYVADVDYVEVAFSPQNEINEDINAQIGYFNIGDYIGDPRLVSSSAETYPELDALSKNYFAKYYRNYNLWDYIRIIKYYDNALFKMVKDYVPVRSSLTTGIVIKQHILERNKYPVPQVNTYTTTSFYGSGSTPNIVWDTPFTFQNIEITGSPIQMYNITGSTGGTMPDLFGLTSSDYTGNNVVNITQSWTGSTPSLLGPVAFTDSTQAEFFNGELSGSSILTDNGGELNEANPYKMASTQLLQYTTSGSGNNSPSSGRINYTVVIGYNGSNYYYYVNKLYINEVDSNGTNISLALSNLSAGDEITFTTYTDVLPPDDYVTATVTGIITSITPVTSTTWTINLSNTLGFQAIVSNFYSSIGGYSILGLDYLSNVIINPFLNDSTGYANSSYNPLVDNAVISRPNPLQFDVDFSSNAITAVNKTTIINASRGTGSATPSTIPESNYTTKRIFNPRYDGCENTSPNFNLLSGSQLPSVEQLTRFGLYYEYAGGTNPEVPGVTAFQIKFLFDELGNVFSPNLSGSYYGDLLDAFPTNTSVVVTPYNTPNVVTPPDPVAQSSIQGVHSVFWPGVYVNSYLTSQSGSLADNGYVTSSIRYTNLDESNIYIDNLGSISFPYWATTSSLYGNNTLLFPITLSTRFNLTMTSVLNAYSSTNVTGSTYINPEWSYYNYPNTTYRQLASTESSPNRTGFDSTITPFTVSPFEYNYATANLSYTGSFAPSPDIIRIQATGSDDYINLEVSRYIQQSGGTGRIELRSDIPVGYVESDGRVNKYTLLRFTPAADKLYLNINKSGGSTGAGFILPLYPSTALSNNLPSIIENLSNKGLI